MNRARRSALLLASLLATAVPLAAHADAQSDLFTAARQCDEAGVQAALAAGADVNALDDNGQNALASSFFCVDATRALLAAGCDPNGGSYPAVIQAANNYATEVLDLLLEAGAEPDKVGTIDPSRHLRVLAAKEREKGKSANKAMIAAWESAAAQTKVLEVTALEQAVQQTNCVPCLASLLAHGADAKAARTDGGLVHKLAAFSMTAQERREAFAKGADAVAGFGLKVPDWYRDLPEDRNGSPAQMLDLLVGAGADVDSRRADGVSAFLVALRLHKLGLSKAMLAQGADAVSRAASELGGRTLETWPLAVAAEFADVELVTAILDKGAELDVAVETAALGVTMNPDYRGNTNWGGDGYTPLIIAIMSGRTDVARLLLERGASVQIGSSGISVLDTRFSMLKCLTEIRNKTPIYWAVERDDLELVQAIAEKMAWKFNPDFTIKQYGGGGDFAGFTCAKFKAKQSPSLYATAIGNLKAAALLSAKGL
ncbi:MAG: hypothetical protein H6732_18335 [Alphaproteobacteria bacterium]|nr:hypothetical protein [Alphaproteobacteria bacterium]